MTSSGVPWISGRSSAVFSSVCWRMASASLNLFMFEVTKVRVMKRVKGGRF